MTYSLTYRRRFWPFKKTIKGVHTHQYIPATNKMWLCLDSGGREIRNWSNCEVFLENDWQAHVNWLEENHIKQTKESGFKIIPPNSEH